MTNSHILKIRLLLIGLALVVFIGSGYLIVNKDQTKATKITATAAVNQQVFYTKKMTARPVKPRSVISTRSS